MAENKDGNRVVSVEVTADRAGQRLDNFLMARLPGVPRSLVYRIIRTGQVRINGGRAKPSRKLAAGEQVRIPPVRVEPSPEPRVPASVIRQLEAAVIHEDQDLLVCDKPAGIAVHAGSGVRWGVVDAFRQSRGCADLELVHRLDRDTSGILVLAKNRAALASLRGQFRDRRIAKRYFALLDGRLAEDKVVVDAALTKTMRGGERIMQHGPEGKPAVTEFRRLQAFRDATFVEALPVTGRTHQIRAHAAWLGLPIAGDARYASRESLGIWRKRGLLRLFLHAHALELEAPGGERLQFSSPLPTELRALLDTL